MIEVLFLGTYHFANPGHDVVKIEVADVLSANKQAEIEQVVDSLAKFHPTKVAVEVLPECIEELSTSYQAYRNGNCQLSPSEVQQLGFRIAARFNHPRLYPINYMSDFPFNLMMEYAQKHDRDFVTYVQDMMQDMQADSNRRQKELSIGRNLQEINNPERIAFEHGIYMRFARVGAGDGYVGAELVSKWYQRNMRIFANLQRIAGSEDRILVIYGSGHAATLREFIKHTPDMTLIEARDYLPFS